MDQERFDQLTRSLARGADRRGVLKGLSGVVGGMLMGHGAVKQTDARSRNINGTACSSPRDCASGLCVDSVCCDAACIGTCEACNLADLEGVCSPVEGAPVGNRGPCPGDGTICSGFCDGLTTAACGGYAGNETACGDASCQNGLLVGAVCSSNGLCISTTSNCGLYACDSDGSSCLTSCDGDLDCVGSAHCVAGVCQGDLHLGSTCDRMDQCQSGNCTDGVCCDTACDGVCQVCGSDGFCAKDADDTACDGGACCHGSCVPLGTIENCLACDDHCLESDVCCGDGCVDLSSDPNNCGTCDHVCEGLTDLCIEGACVECGDDAKCAYLDFACGTGVCGTTGFCEVEPFDDDVECEGQSGVCCGGTCTPLGTVQNCGVCGDACGSHEVCDSNHECVCDTYYKMCNGECIGRLLCCTDSDCDQNTGGCADSFVCSGDHRCAPVNPEAPNISCGDGVTCDGAGRCRGGCTTLDIDTWWYFTDADKMSANFIVDSGVWYDEVPILYTYRNGVLVDLNYATENGGWFLFSNTYVTCEERDQLLYVIVDRDFGCVEYPTHRLGC